MENPNQEEREKEGEGNVVVGNQVQRLEEPRSVDDVVERGMEDGPDSRSHPMKKRTRWMSVKNGKESGKEKEIGWRERRRIIEESSVVD